MEIDQLLPRVPTTAQPEQYNGYQGQQSPPFAYQQEPSHSGQYGHQYQPIPGYQYTTASCNRAANTLVIELQQPHILRGIELPPPPDYMALSIFTCLCCCCPVGILAIYKTAESKNRYYNGDDVGAWESAYSARSLSILGINCGTFLITYTVFYAILCAASVTNED